MRTLLAGTAITAAGVLNVSFLRFCPESCRSGRDNIADVLRLRQGVLALASSRKARNMKNALKYLVAANVVCSLLIFIAPQSDGPSFLIPVVQVLTVLSMAIVAILVAKNINTQMTKPKR